MRHWCAFAAILFWLEPALAAGSANLSSEDAHFFEKKVRPILVARCYDCHSKQHKIKGQLRLDTKAGWIKGGLSGAAVVPGNPGASMLIEAVLFKNPDLEMPPKGKISDEEIATLTEWIRRGAPDPREDADEALPEARIDIEKSRDFWAFRPVQDTPLPSVSSSEWAVSEVDRFILAGLEVKSLAPSPDADPATLLRRLYFDLTGLPPADSEVSDFVKACGKAGMKSAVAQWADKLIGTQAFGEKWGRHWLDLARYADSNGSSFNPPYHTAWRYRNFVLDAFRNDMPFNQFVRKQIAGDLLPAASQQERDENLIATGYLMLGSKVLGLFDKETLTMDVADEQIDTLGQSLLGLTLGCARCHDHKFDPIPTRDYYALAGIFTSTITLEDRLGGPREDESDWSRRGLGENGDEKLQAFLKTRRYEWVKAQSVLDSQDRIAAAELALKSETDPALRASLEKKLASARKDWEKHGPKLRGYKMEVPPIAIAVRDSDSPADTHIRLRGVASSRGDLVPRGFLQVASIEGALPVNRAQSGRVELAEWIVHERNPLTARVWVNRVWKHLFREGLVRSVDNFGLRGEKPTHPELLDFLARRFVECGWSTQALVRTLVTSRAYGMSSAYRIDAAEADPENRLLWRQNRRRLEPEEIRDAILWASGDLNLHSAEGMIDHLPLADLGNNPRAMNIQDTRRTVYQPVIRTMESDVYQVFDAPNNSVTTGQRASTTVAPQALYFMNSPFVQQASTRIAQSLLRDLPRKDSVALIDRACRRILSRPPSERELTILRKYLDTQHEGYPGPTEHDLAKLCQSLFASTLFQFVD